MRKKLFMLVLASALGIVGTLTPRQASALGSCPPVCNDPEQTCCLRCGMSAQHVCVCGNEYICV
jgi:hypothetical protein